MRCALSARGRVCVVRSCASAVIFFLLSCRYTTREESFRRGSITANYIGSFDIIVFAGYMGERSKVARGFFVGRDVEFCF